MKKLLCITLGFILIFSLVSCGSSKYPMNGKKPSSTEERIKAFATQYPAPAIPKTAKFVLSFITAIAKQEDFETTPHEGEDGTYQLLAVQKRPDGSDLTRITMEYIPNTEDSLTWFQFSISDYNNENDLEMVKTLMSLPASELFTDPVKQFAFIEWFTSYAGKNKKENQHGLTCETIYNSQNNTATFCFRNENYDAWADAYNDYVFDA